MKRIFFATRFQLTISPPFFNKEKKQTNTSAWYSHAPKTTEDFSHYQLESLWSFFPPSCSRKKQQHIFFILCSQFVLYHPAFSNTRKRKRCQRHTEKKSWKPETALKTKKTKIRWSRMLPSCLPYHATWRKFSSFYTSITVACSFKIKENKDPFQAPPPKHKRVLCVCVFSLLNLVFRRFVLRPAPFPSHWVYFILYGYAANFFSFWTNSMFPIVHISFHFQVVVLLRIFFLSFFVSSTCWRKFVCGNELAYANLLLSTGNIFFEVATNNKVYSMKGVKRSRCFPFLSKSTLASNCISEEKFPKNHWWTLCFTLTDLSLSFVARENIYWREEL